MTPNGDFIGPGPEWSVHKIQELKQQLDAMQKRNDAIEKRLELIENALRKALEEPA